MYAFIRGKLACSHPTYAVLDTQGVGYLLHVGPNTYGALPPIGHEVTLFTSFVVRENGHSLYGFLQEGECELFENLQQVTGVGPKMALNLISHLPGSELAQAIRQNDIVRLTKVPGVGKKTAERLVVELKDKALSSGFEAYSTPLPENQLLQDAMSALVNLGYTQANAQKALKKGLEDNPQADLATLIASALRIRA